MSSISIPILFEDESFLAVDKPAGMVVNRSENATENTVQDWIEELRSKKLEVRSKKKEEEEFYNRAGIVHRLDKDTSGILLIAKDPGVFLHLQSQFGNRTVVKRYTALVHGKISEVEGTIQIPVGRLPWARRKFGVLPSGREALTAYRVITVLKRVGPLLQGSDPVQSMFYTLVEVAPKTGRTHQIRIHFKHIGHAIVGDPLYAGKHVLEEDHAFCPRLFLHASYMKIIHPKSFGDTEFESDVPPELKTALSRLTPMNRG